MKPNTVTKPGKCPPPRRWWGSLGLCAEPCSQDGDCPSNTKCCSNWCGRQCMKPYTVYSIHKAKPGECPHVSSIAHHCFTFTEHCHEDSDCPKDEKCCSSGCGYWCLNPYTVPKPATCPPRKWGIVRLCAELCSHDSDCPNNKKCCSHACGHQCMTPYTAKPGFCPPRESYPWCYVLSPSCSDDTDCPNDEKCCFECGPQCKVPDPLVVTGRR
ncbi:hypothetical protein LDENG_00110730 [Lucifuga dentata]|nr:hypothetical protein LDENG_00110730 [Lucifuga dentata]